MRVLLALMVLAAAASPATAQQKFENLDRLDGLVAMTVGANLGEPGGPVAPIDRRLKLAACPSTPNVSGPTFGAAIIKCDAVGWRIRVPLKADGVEAEVAMLTQRVVAARPAPSREKVVKKGDPVQLVAGGAAFSVSRLMVADEDGAIGTMIRVRGEDKKASPVLAQVVEMGIVRIPGFKEN